VHDALRHLHRRPGWRHRRAGPRDPGRGAHAEQRAAACRLTRPGRHRGGLRFAGPWPRCRVGGSAGRGRRVVSVRTGEPGRRAHQRHPRAQRGDLPGVVRPGMSGFASRVAARARDGVTVVFVVTTLTGVGSPSPVLVAPAMADPAGMYGDPPKAAQYWAPQSFGNNCVLMSVADVVGQVSGQMPSEQQIIDLAQNTPSVAEEGKTVYTDTEGDGVDTRDISVLLAHYGIHATTS